MTETADNSKSALGKALGRIKLMRIYPRIWPVVFLIGGIVSVVSGAQADSGGMAHHGHGGGAAGGLFSVFGAPVTLHDLMWFAMAAAHLESFWGSHCVCR